MYCRAAFAAQERKEGKADSTLVRSLLGRPACLPAWPGCFAFLLLLSCSPVDDDGDDGDDDGKDGTRNGNWNEERRRASQLQVDEREEEERNPLGRDGEFDCAPRPLACGKKGEEDGGRFVPLFFLKKKFQF